VAGCVGRVLDVLQDALQQQRRHERDETLDGGEGALDQELGPEVFEQVPGQAVGLLDLPVRGKHVRGFVLGDEIPDVFHLKGLAVARPHDRIHPSEGHDGQQTGDRLVRRLHAIFVHHLDGAVSLSRRQGNEAEK